MRPGLPRRATLAARAALVGLLYAGSAASALCADGAPITPVNQPSAAPAVLAARAGMGGDYRPVRGGLLRSVLPGDGVDSPALVAPFQLRTRPVSNAEFRAFIQQHPEWRRGDVAALFAGSTYLRGWSGADDPAPLADNAPVVNVSWYAAQAYCASEQARLPRWHEWEFAGAADDSRADARDDPAWLARILNWYSRPGNTPPGAIGQGTPNYYGMQDMHGLVWEWVEDYNGLFVNADSRAKGEQKQLDYCGGAAVTLADRRNYAVLMRLALLAAMESNQDGANLGFRCARDAVPTIKESTP
ncbi:formylglycine-generating enzyme family protein [Rugamonas rubra]|uniref:Formylglycine-generating enzyme, required for sulfatase activity, contains SUMF1/FGE domain n=1 Tax=Rugamonas rubra TaxID=758825 RepID=A0A1I4TQV6_9BURK|nr:formylglycine-generating enzyme family protein [Rugamonas rubra]SFM79076.1 Formylglycine-generating enzyme, required for sulfatase activity, contains SUMF1/FGE domain [Rugamonas rubra]